MKTSLTALCFILFLTISGPGFTLGAESPIATVNEEDTGLILAAADFWINLPDEKNASPFLKITPGTKVKILAREKEYFRIEHRNLMGYVRKEHVKILGDEPVPAEAAPNSGTSSPPGAGDITTRYVLTKATSLRSQPDSKASVLLRFAPGDKVEVLESTGKYWWKVRFRNRTGWAKSALLKKE